MGLRCAVCQHPDRLAIDVACSEGQTTKSITERYTGTQRPLTVSQIDHHRVSGHAARALTAAVLGVANGPMAELMKIEVANKVWRVSRLQATLDRLDMIVADREKAFAHLPGGRSGFVGGRFKMLGTGENAREVEESFFDRDLVQEMRGILEQAAKECGEWRPGGSEGKDDGAAQSITVQQIVSGGSQGAIILEKQVQDTGRPWQTRQYDAIQEPLNNSSLLNGLEERIAAVPVELVTASTEAATHDSIQSRDKLDGPAREGDVVVLDGATADDEPAE